MIKDFGKLCYFLGIEISRSFKGLFLSQIKLLYTCLRKSNFFGIRLLTLPSILHGNNLSSYDDSQVVDPTQNSCLIVKIGFNIYFAIDVVSQNMKNLMQSHREVVLRNLQYHKGLMVRCYFIRDLDFLDSLSVGSSYSRR